MMEAKKLTLEINGRERQVTALPNQTLLETLREQAFFEVKCGCEKGDCGTCAVLLDGRAVNSCLTLTWTVEGRSITTAAGLGTEEVPHPVVDAFVKHGAIQCGFCSPGLIIAAESLLRDIPAPSLDEIKVGLAGNLCRCTGYSKVFRAVQDAAAELRDGGKQDGK